MPRPTIILDCDPGHDDAIAIVLAGRHTELLGITTVNGNAPLSRTTANALVLTQLLDLPTPVHSGAAHPLLAPVLNAEYIHGESGMDGAELPNVTRAVARLGRPVAYLGRLSGDRFGQLIRANLDQHGVKIAVEAPSAAPTTLALVDLDPVGVPSYHFYLDGTSAVGLRPADTRSVRDLHPRALHVGTLAC